MNNGTDRILAAFVAWAKVYRVWEKVSNSAAVELHELILQAENRLELQQLKHEQRDTR